MRTAPRWLAALAVASAVVGLSSLLATGTADAATPPAGTLTIYDAAIAAPATSGKDITSVQGLTSGTCDVPGADSYNVVLVGPGVFAPKAPDRLDGLVVVSSGSAGFSTTDPIRFDLRGSFKDFAEELGGTIVPGDYVITMRCVNQLDAIVFQTYSATLTFSSPTAFTVKGASTTTTTTTAAATTTTSAAETATTSAAATTTTSTTTTTATTSATTTTTDTTSGSATTTESATPTVDPGGSTNSGSGGAGTASGPSGTLAYTGAPVDTITLAGFALLVLGAALRYAGRRRGLRG